MRFLERDDVNQITWDDDMDSEVRLPALALTRWWYQGSPGNILEVDCAFNAHPDDNVSWSTATPTPGGSYDIQSVMLHEFGHYLSLGHSTSPAVMQPTIPSHVQRRSLMADDIDGIIAIYGSDDPVDPPDPPDPPAVGWGGTAPTASVVGEGVKTGQSSDIVNYLLILVIPVGSLWCFMRKRK